MSPVYDSERFGFHFVASPRMRPAPGHGPVTRNMEVRCGRPTRQPSPKLVVAVGDCAHTLRRVKGS